ncbi:MAG: tRNA epoxyqueuosine(34) reductase QueG [Planctomycetota bacterium]
MTGDGDKVLRLAEAEGFALAGIASAEPSGRGEAVRAWLDAGKHGSMRWLEENLEVRLDPGRLVEAARSVIAVADVYVDSSAERNTEVSGLSCDPVSTKEAGLTDRTGRIARYAHGDDYHKVIKKRLHRLCDTLAERHPGHTFRAAVDTAPALERELAARAGLGWQGKNTLMIHPRHGSYFLLGLIVTTLELTPPGQGASNGGEPVPSRNRTASTPCANCTRCIDACPTGAIDPAGYTMDASRCVSYLTIEHRGVIDDDLLPGVGDWLAGCDVCQEVCPYNQVAKRHSLPLHPAYDAGPRKLDEGLDVLEVLNWTAEDRARVFRGSALKRIKLDMIRRNALIVAGNRYAGTGDLALIEAIERCAEDEAELVATTARQVMDCLAIAS